jgi:hypothetical protein
MLVPQVIASMLVPQGTTSTRVLPYMYDSSYTLVPRVKQLLAGEAEDTRHYTTTTIVPSYLQVKQILEGEAEDTRHYTTTTVPSYLQVKQLFAGEAEDKRARFVAQPRVEGWSCRLKLINQSNNESIHASIKAGRKRARARERERESARERASESESARERERERERMRKGEADLGFRVRVVGFKV